MHAQFADAVRYVTAGNLAAGEIVCRNILDADPGNSDALNLLGVISGRVAMWDHAQSYFRRALRSDGQNAAAQRNLASLAQIDRRPAAEGTKRYLVIKSWGAGFWSDVSQVLGSLLLSEITNRIPVICWGSNSLYGDGSHRDAFSHYFEPVSDVSLDDLAEIPDATFFPAKWNQSNLASDNFFKWGGNGLPAAAIYFLNRQETIAVSDFYVGVIDVLDWIPRSHAMHGKDLGEVHRYLAGKYLRVNAELKAAVDTFVHDNFRGETFLAAHLRGSDKITEDPGLQTTNGEILAALASLDASRRIFLLTDDVTLHDQAVNRFGARIRSMSCQRTETTTGIHKSASVNRVQAGREILMDVMIAMRAGAFVGNGLSNVSAMIAILRTWDRGACRLVGQSNLHQRFLHLHLPRTPARMTR